MIGNIKFSTDEDYRTKVSLNGEELSGVISAKFDVAEESFPNVRLHMVLKPEYEGKADISAYIDSESVEDAEKLIRFTASLDDNYRNRLITSVEDVLSDVLEEDGHQFYTEREIAEKVVQRLTEVK
jgi:hypothetical protein